MESIHHLLMKSHTKLNRKVMNRAAQLGLTSGKPKILEYLHMYGESNQKAIAEYCEIEQATAGNILLGMENEELITRRQKDGNRRSLYVSLTPKGEELAVKVIDILNEEENGITAGLSEQEKNTLALLLDKISR